MKRNLLVIISSIYIFYSSNLLAGAERWTHYGLRPLAMGNAYVAVADDYNALFYNPAGIARLKSWDGELINPSLILSSSIKTFISDLGKNSGSSVSASMDLIEKYTGEAMYGGLALTPHLIFPNFGFGVGIDLAGEMGLHRYPSVDLDVGGRVLFPVTFGFNSWGDKLSVGATLKGRATIGIDRELSIEDVTILKSLGGEEKKSILQEYVQGGTGFGADIGLLFSPTKVMEPTLGISITDIGDTSYQKLDLNKNSLGIPDSQRMSVNFGVSMKPWTLRDMYLLTAVDVHSINSPDSFSKKFNLGMEYGLGSILKIQTGIYQGYLSGGVQVDVGLFNLKLVSYSEELASVAGNNENRRYALQVKLFI